MASREGPGNERWLIGRHVDRILEATAAPIFWENLDKRVWLTAVSHSVTALAHVAAPYADRKMREGWDKDVSRARGMEEWLAIFGDVYQVLAEAGKIGYANVPHEDASKLFGETVDEGSEEGVDGDTDA